MKRISIKSVVAQVAMILDDRYWNDAVILENVTRAFRQMNLEQKWEEKVQAIELENHKAALPNDYKEIIQIAYQQSTRGPWYPMTSSTNTMFHCTCEHDSCSNCPHQYSVSSSGILTSSLKDGVIKVAYLGYPTDEEGDQLIPDDETVKEALFHYVLYRYWLQKDLMKETGADKRMVFHLQMWSTLSQKALSLNLPSLAQLENIRVHRSKLLPVSNGFSSFFSSLSSEQFNKYP